MIIQSALAQCFQNWKLADKLSAKFRSKECRSHASRRGTIERYQPWGAAVRHKKSRSWKKKKKRLSFAFYRRRRYFPPFCACLSMISVFRNIAIRECSTWHMCMCAYIHIQISLSQILINLDIDRIDVTRGNPHVRFICRLIRVRIKGRKVTSFLPSRLFF